MKYTLRIAVAHFSAYTAERRVNELPITEETALNLLKDYKHICPCPITSSGSSKMDISVGILKDGEIIGGWRGI